MRWFRRRPVREDKLKTKLIHRLAKVPETETMRWIDNIHTGLGMDVQELRKSLSRGDSEQALIYLEDIRVGAVSLLAASEVLSSSRTQ